MNKLHLVLVLLVAVVMLTVPAAAEVALGGSVGGSTATISVTSSPSGASVYDAGVYQGTTPCNIIENFCCSENFPWSRNSTLMGKQCSGDDFLFVCFYPLLKLNVFPTF